MTRWTLPAHRRSGIASCVATRDAFYSSCVAPLHSAHACASSTQRTHTLSPVRQCHRPRPRPRERRLRRRPHPRHPHRPHTERTHTHTPHAHRTRHTTRIARGDEISWRKFAARARNFARRFTGTGQLRPLCLPDDGCCLCTRNVASIDSRFPLSSPPVPSDHAALPRRAIHLRLPRRVHAYTLIPHHNPLLVVQTTFVRLLTDVSFKYGCATSICRALYFRWSPRCQPCCARLGRCRRRTSPATNRATGQARCRAPVRCIFSEAARA